MKDEYVLEEVGNDLEGIEIAVLVGALNHVRHLSARHARLRRRLRHHLRGLRECFCVSTEPTTLFRGLYLKHIQCLAQIAVDAAHEALRECQE
jgi:hypothetical protein